MNMRGVIWWVGFFSVLALISFNAVAGEVEIAKKWCMQQSVNFQVEYKLEEPYSMPTRVDCVVNGIAWEVEWADKWSQSPGQTLYYARRTGLKPGIVLIAKGESDVKYIKRLHESLSGVTYNYNGEDVPIAVVVIEERDYQ